MIFIFYISTDTFEFIVKYYVEKYRIDKYQKP